MAGLCEAHPERRVRLPDSGRVGRRSAARSVDTDERSQHPGVQSRQARAGQGADIQGAAPREGGEQQEKMCVAALHAQEEDSGRNREAGREGPGGQREA